MSSIIEQAKQFRERFAKVQAEIGKVIVGQPEIVQGVMTCLFVGLLWRTVRLLVEFPIWGDEAMLLVNVVDRDYHALTQTLSFVQVAPLLFLWGEKTAVVLLHRRHPGHVARYTLAATAAGIASRTHVASRRIPAGMSSLSIQPKASRKYATSSSWAWNAWPVAYRM